MRRSAVRSRSAPPAFAREAAKAGRLPRATARQAPRQSFKQQVGTSHPFHLAPAEPAPLKRLRLPERPHMLNPIAWIIVEIIDIYVWVVIAAVVVSWLIAFGVINLYNQTARQIVHILEVLTEPFLRRIRRIVPPIGGLDLSPLILILLLYFIRYAIFWASVRFGI